MADIIIPGTDKILLDGTIVILAGFDDVKYILHNGYYNYIGEVFEGWYGVSIPDQNIIPIVVNMLVGCEVVYYPDSNCQCKYPSGNIPYTTDDKYQLQRAFITVDTMIERDALSPNLSITDLVNGRLVRVNKPNNVDFNPKYYVYRYNEELTGAYWDDANFGGGLQPDDLGYEFEIDPNTDKLMLTEYGKVVTCVLNWLQYSPSGSTYPTDQVEINLARLEILRNLDNTYQSQWGRILVYINVGGKYYPAAVVRDNNKNIISVQSIIFEEQRNRIDNYIIQGTTIANYTQTISPMLEYGSFNEYGDLGASQYVIAQWLYSLINVENGIAGLDNHGIIRPNLLPIASSSGLGVIKAGTWISIDSYTGEASVVIPAETFDAYGAASAVYASINELIPNTATAQNQLADKNFVNSSVATNTANFIGTFDSVAELEAYSGTVTNNDYAFVVEYDQQDPTQVVAYNRYKYNGETQEWLYEYTLNNSSFTAEQWAAINSAITAELVTAYSAHIADSTIHVTAQNKTDWNAKYDKPSGGIPKTDLASAVQTSLTAADNAIPSSEKGVAGGVPTLGNDGKIPKSQLPPTVPDGGTTGQVLTKQSNADGDADWEDIPDVNINDLVQTSGDLMILDGGTSTSNASNLYQDANGQSF